MGSASLKRVGFWAPHHQETKSPIVEVIMSVLGSPGLPDPHHLVDSKWDPRERARVLTYVTNARFGGESYAGYSTCRICNKRDNGSADFSDGVYLWPEGFGHYIETHQVRPPQNFVDHVLKRAS